MMHRCRRQPPGGDLLGLLVAERLRLQPEKRTTWPWSFRVARRILEEDDLQPVLAEEPGITLNVLRIVAGVDIGGVGDEAAGAARGGPLRVQPRPRLVDEKRPFSSRSRWAWVASSKDLRSMPARAFCHRCDMARAKLVALGVLQLLILMAVGLIRPADLRAFAVRSKAPGVAERPGSYI